MQQAFLSFLAETPKAPHDVTIVKREPESTSLISTSTCLYQSTLCTCLPLFPLPGTYSACCDQSCNLDNEYVAKFREKGFLVGEPEMAFEALPR